MRIIFDKVGERFYEYGVDHGVLYLQGTTGDYDKGVAWNGLTAVNESPSGAEPNDLYADNILYASIRSAEKWGGSIEAYHYPEEFNACNGLKPISDGVYAGQQKRDGFGLTWRTMIGNDTASEEDDGYVIHIVYGLTASPSESSNSTINDSPDAQSMTWDVSSIPIAVDGYDLKPLSSIRIESLKAGKEKMKALEDILYGTEDTEPRLPLPEEIFRLMESTTGGTEETEL